MKCSSPSECPVCYEDMNDAISVHFPCKHGMCLTCFSKLKSHNCALCRKDFHELIPDSIRKSVSDVQVADGGESLIARYYTLYDMEIDYYLAFAGQRVRREIISSRLRRLLRANEVPLFSYVRDHVQLDTFEAEDDAYNIE